MSHCLRDPKLLARLLEEQRTVLKDPDTPLTWEHLGEMDLLHNCMRETLRMYPPLVRLDQSPGSDGSPRTAYIDIDVLWHSFDKVN